MPEDHDQSAPAPETGLTEQHREHVLRERLAGLFRASGHVAAHGVEDLAAAAAKIALAPLGAFEE
jgi:hypothetical protein